MKETMPHWLDKQADLAPDNNAIESPLFDSITFSVLRDRAQQFAKRLASLGIKKGDHVAIYATNCLEMVIAIHALSYLGAVVVLLNTRLSRNELDFQIRDANVGFILTEGDNSDLFDNEKDVESATFATVEQQQSTVVALQTEIDPEDVFTIIYTSGTTGKPKGVVHTYGNHWSSAIASALNLGLERQDKWLATLPLFHIGGFSLLMKNVIYGMPIYLLDKFDVASINQAIMTKGVTIVSVVAVMLDRLIDNLENRIYPETFRCMLLGGGPASKHLLEKASQHQIPVFQTYGMTETSSQIVTLSPTDALKKIGSAGKALFSAQVKILKDNQVTLPFEIGEIFVKGPMVTKGYYENEKANNAAFQQEWLATGDLGYLDSEGYLYVVDRRKDLIVSGGENIYPAEVEHVLIEIDGIKEAGVVGRKDATWGKVPVAFLVTEKELDFELVKQQCGESLAKYKVPKAYYLVESLPRNASNKLLRHQLEGMLEQ